MTSSNSKQLHFNLGYFTFLHLSELNPDDAVCLATTVVSVDIRLTVHISRSLLLADCRRTATLS